MVFLLVNIACMFPPTIVVLCFHCHCHGATAFNEASLMNRKAASQLLSMRQFVVPIHRAQARLLGSIRFLD